MRPPSVDDGSCGESPSHGPEVGVGETPVCHLGANNLATKETAKKRGPCLLAHFVLNLADLSETTCSRPSAHEGSHCA